MNITINQVQEIALIPVKQYFADDSGYQVISGMPMFAQKLINNMSYGERMRYSFFQNQLGRNTEVEEC